MLVAQPTTAPAQVISGVVRDDAGPLGGVVVVLVDSSGREVSRTLSDRNGRFTTARATSATRLRAVRIGFRPVVVKVGGPAGNLSIDVVMERAPVLLSTVRISGGAGCASSADAAIVSELWDRIRPALLSAIVAREANPARVQLLEYTRRMDATRRLITQQRLVLKAGQSDRPVAASRSAEQLASRGYRESERGEEVFYAPDADVLADDAFRAAHCFGVTKANGQVGIRFAPRGDQTDVVDIKGVLWLNDEATALNQLEYSYTNLDPEAMRAGAGGTLSFKTLTNGVVLIDSWSIVVPSVTAVNRTGDVGSTRSFVNGISETGAYLLSARFRDSTEWMGALGGIRGAIREEKGPGPMPGVRVSTTGSEAETDSSGVYGLTPLPPGRYRVSAVDTALGDFLKARERNREVLVTRNDTVSADFRMTPRSTLIQEMCKGESKRKDDTALLGAVDPGATPLPDQLKVMASWYTSEKGTLDLTHVAKESRTVGVSRNGTFLVCGVPPRGSWITLRLISGTLPIADTSVAPNALASSASTGLRHIAWKLPSRYYR